MRCNLFGVACDVATKAELLQAIESGVTVRVATPNPEILLAARKSQALRGALGSMTHCLIDGAGVAIWWRIGRIFYTLPSIERVAGASFCEELFAIYQHGGKRFAFLGSAPGTASAAAAALRRRYPKLQIVFTEDGGVPAQDGTLETGVVERLVRAKPDITLVTFGAPKQELVIARLRSLGLPALLGVGGTLHFYVNRTRAPKLLRQLGLEWIWRVCTVRGHAKRAWNAVVVFSAVAAGWLLQGGPRQSAER